MLNFASQVNGQLWFRKRLTIEYLLFIIVHFLTVNVEFCFASESPMIRLGKIHNSQFTIYFSSCKRLIQQVQIQNNDDKRNNPDTDF